MVCPLAKYALQSDSFITSGVVGDNFPALSFVCAKLNFLQIFFEAVNHDSCLLKKKEESMN